MRISKKYFGFMVLVAVLLFNSTAFATGSVNQNTTQNFDLEGNQVKKIFFVCIGDASNGSIPNTAMNTSNLNFIKGMRLFQVEAYPTSGGTAPDAANVFVFDADGMDLLGSVDGTTAYRGLSLIHATLKRATSPDIYHVGQTAHVDYYPIVTGTLTIAVAAQATVNADWTIVLTFIK